MTARLRSFPAVAALALLVAGTGARADWRPFSTSRDNAARAVAHDDAAQLRQFVATGDSPNEADAEGRTGLHTAALNGNLPNAAVLIKRGAKLDIKDKLGNTPLHYAADRNQAEMTDLLLDLGAAVDPANRNGVTPLMMAASRGNLAVVQLLLAKGASAAKTDFTGRDAVAWAADSRRPGVVQALQRAAPVKR